MRFWLLTAALFLAVLLPFIPTGSAEENEGSVYIHESALRRDADGPPASRCFSICQSQGTRFGINGKDGDIVTPGVHNQEPLAIISKNDSTLVPQARASSKSTGLKRTSSRKRSVLISEELQDSVSSSFVARN